MHRAAGLVGMMSMELEPVVSGLIRWHGFDAVAAAVERMRPAEAKTPRGRPVLWKDPALVTLFLEVGIVARMQRGKIDQALATIWNREGKQVLLMQGMRPIGNLATLRTRYYEAKRWVASQSPSAQARWDRMIERSARRRVHPK